jgi:hypothetical protein
MDVPNREFVPAGSLEELKAKGRLEGECRHGSSELWDVSVGCSSPAPPILPGAGCPLLGVKRTLIGRCRMSAFDPKRTFGHMARNPGLT